MPRTRSTPRTSISRTPPAISARTGTGWSTGAKGDFDNARYWFRRAGTLGCSGALHRAASEVSADMARQPAWDAYLFTGQCEQARHGAEELLPELVKLQQIEFETLFDYSWRQSGLA